MFRRLKALLSIALPATLIVTGCAGGGFRTPLEEADGDVLTSHEDMMAFLSDLRDRTQSFTIDTIGSSVEGRSLVVLHFTGAAAEQAAAEGVGVAEKVKVLIDTQQHGNEPSGTEAAIALARDIATGDFTDFLGSADFYLIPQVNPDGGEARQRRNAQDKDLNRDHLTLSSPEVFALHAFFNEHMPEVTLDVHEYGVAGRSWVEAGLNKDFGQQIGALSNANMSMVLREYAWDRFIPDMKERLAPKDVFLQRYLVTDGPDARFRYSTTALNDGRNSMGIYNSLSFLIEGKNGLTVEENIRERARQQLETMKAFLMFASENAAEIRQMVEAERMKLSGEGAPSEVSLVMDYVPDPDRPTVSVGVIDIESGSPDTLIIEAFHPLVESTLSVQRPLGYAIPAGLTDVIEVLERHGIELSRAEGPIRAIVESYRIQSAVTTEKEDKEFLEVGVSGRRGTAVIPEGDVIVWCDQIATNLIVTLLEPQSQWGLAPLPRFASMLEVDSTYPIRRIVDVME